MGDIACPMREKGGSPIAGVQPIKFGRLELKVGIKTSKERFRGVETVCKAEDEATEWWGGGVNTPNGGGKLW